MIAITHMLEAHDTKAAGDTTAEIMMPYLLCLVWLQDLCRFHL